MGRVAELGGLSGSFSVAGLSVEQYLRLLAGADPVPGGGCAAAVAGAQGAALVAMVARLAHRRADQEAWAARLEQAVQAAEERCRRLRALADEDAEAYHQVMRAYRLPRTTDREREIRGEAVRQALARAAEVPLSVAETAVQALEVLVELLPAVPSSVLPDAAVAGWLLRACVEGCAVNVRANWQAMRKAPGEGPHQLEALLGRSRRLFDELRSHLGALANGGVLPAGV